MRSCTTPSNMTNWMVPRMVVAAVVLILTITCLGCPVSGNSAPPPSGLPNHDGSQRFNVEDYGADGNGKVDSSKAFLSAWEEACSHPGNATMYIPEGTYLTGKMKFEGPCQNEPTGFIEVDIRGTLRAPIRSIDEFDDDESETSDWIVFQRLRGLRLTGSGPSSGVLDGQGKFTWESESCRKKSTCKNLPTSIRLVNVSDGSVNNIKLVNSKGFHMRLYRSDNIHVYNVEITAPEDSPNTDGIHISQSNNINISSSKIGVGDDCISIGPGSRNLSISNIKCGPGHGISVGSLGRHRNEENVEIIKVSNCEINGTTNGVRIKSWAGSYPSSASNIEFENITMTNVSNPIIVDQAYCPSNTCHDVNKPSKVKLSHLLFKDIIGTYNKDFAVSILCSPQVSCTNISLVNVFLNATEESESSKIGRANLNGAIDGFMVLNSRLL